MVGWQAPDDADKDNSDGLGGTVFRPLKGPASRKKCHGYLPDPAAQTMSLRLRVSGTDNYLKGDVLVDLYDPDKGVRYPNALPLAVTVVKLDKPREKLAKSIHDVVSGSPTAIIRLGADDKPVPDRTGQGVRLRSLKLQLAPGEQFELEVTCLPNRRALASWFSMPETMGVQHLAAQQDDAVKKEPLRECGADPSKLTALVSAATAAAPRTGLAGMEVPAPASLEAVAQKLLYTIQNNWPLTELASPTTLHIPRMPSVHR